MQICHKAHHHDITATQSSEILATETAEPFSPLAPSIFPFLFSPILPSATYSLSPSQSLRAALRLSENPQAKKSPLRLETAHTRGNAKSGALVQDSTSASAMSYGAA
jgi:hypothetical protein